MKNLWTPSLLGLRGGRLIAAVVLSIPTVILAQEAEINPVAYTYAEMYGVSIQEAENRLSRESEAVALNKKLQQEQPESFAGLYMEHSPVFRVVVRFTSDPKARLARYTNDPLYVAELAPYSFEMLMSTQDEIAKQLTSLNTEFVSELDIKKSEINLYVRNPSITSRDIGILMNVARFINVRKTEEFVTLTDLSGGGRVEGLNVEGKLEACTTGFNVIDASRELGISTAGHCPDTLNDIDTGVSLAFQADQNTGDYDQQWNKQSSGSPQKQLNKITAIGSLNNSITITGVTSSSDLMVGQTVCKYGITSGYACGAVADVNAPENYEGQAGSYVRVASNGHKALSQGGDSGGPVFGNGGTAFGIVHGHPPASTGHSLDLIFMPIERFTAMGVEVLTKPFEFTTIPPASGPMGGIGNITLNFQGTPKFPMVNTSVITYCPPGFTCTAGNITYATNVPSPLTETFRCNAPTSTPSAVFGLKSFITDASGIVTPAVEYQFTCVQQTASEADSYGEPVQRTFELVHP